MDAVLVRPVEVEVEIEHDVRLAAVERVEERAVRGRLTHVEGDAEVALDARDDIVDDAAVMAILEVGVGLLLRRGEGGEMVMLREVRLFLRREEERRARVPSAVRAGGADSA